MRESRRVSYSSRRGSRELDGGEAEFVAETVSRFGELFESFTAVGLEEVEWPARRGRGRESGLRGGGLCAYCRDGGGRDLGRRRDVVSSCAVRECFRAGVGFETGVADGQRQGCRGEACFAEALQAFLERWLSRVSILATSRFFTEGVIVGYGFGFGVPMRNS